MREHAGIDRRAFFGVAAATALSGYSRAFAQPNITEKKIDPIDLPLDKLGVWTLHFRYKPPRIVTVDGFDKKGKPQKQVVWYMWYQVYNLAPEGRTAEPVTFMPEFELVTKDFFTSHLDEPQPFIVNQLNKLENPQDHPTLRLKTSIEISKNPIPPSKPDAIPRVVTGVAVWTDMAEKAPKTNKFSVYVTGLSNGLSTENLRTGEKLIKRKTLQINFIRPTDDNNPQITDIRPDDSAGPAEQWIYRLSSTVQEIGQPAPKLPPAIPPG